MMDVYQKGEGQNLRTDQPERFRRRKTVVHLESTKEKAVILVKKHKVTMYILFKI